MSAKQQRSIRKTDIQGSNGRQLEHTEVFEDSLLPEALEIERLTMIDPNIMQWLKERAEKEQDFRHEAFNNKIKIVKSSESGERKINYLGIICSFTVLMAGLYFSYLIILEGKDIIGSIFSGGIILLGATSLYSVNKRKR